MIELKNVNLKDDYSLEEFRDLSQAGAAVEKAPC